MFLPMTPSNSCKAKQNKEVYIPSRNLFRYQPFYNNYAYEAI